MSKIANSVLKQLQHIKAGMRAMLVAVMVVMLALPALHMEGQHDYGHDPNGSGLKGGFAAVLSHLALDAEEALFAHAHEDAGLKDRGSILDDARARGETAHEVSHHHGNGFHIHLLQNALSESRSQDSKPSVFMLERIWLLPLRSVLHSLGVAEQYNFAHTIGLASLRFISRLTSLPPPQA